MSQVRRVSFFVAALLLLSGCGTRSISGGTPGLLSSDGQPLGDVQITAFQNVKGNVQPIGFAVTSADGTFALVTNGAGGPLYLEPGEYVFTLESVGAPVVIPDDYEQAEKSPLKLYWDGSGSLDFEIRGVRLQSQQPVHPAAE